MSKLTKEEIEELDKILLHWEENGGGNVFDWVEQKKKEWQEQAVEEYEKRTKDKLIIRLEPDKRRMVDID